LAALPVASYALALVQLIEILALAQILGSAAVQALSGAIERAPGRAQFLGGARLRFAPDPGGPQHPVAAWSLALLAALAQAALRIVVANDDSAVLLRPAELGSLLVGTHFGQQALVHAALLILAAGIDLAGRAVSGRGNDPSIAGPLRAFFVAGAVLASMGLQGHLVAGASGGLQANGVALLLGLHGVLAASWVGALPRLYFAATHEHPRVLAALLRGFSRLGLMGVALLVADGALLALQAGVRPGSTLASAYGQVLALKLTAVAGMGLAAILNRNRFTPALAREPGQARAGLRRAIGVERTLGVGVLGLACLLGQMAPPAN
jgi:putative copper export protein